MIKEIKNSEPLARSELYILIALAQGERHGYEIMQYIKAVSENNVRLGPGTLYVAIKRLLEAGLVATAGKRQEKDKRVRKYYKLTEKGRKRLGLELAQLKAFLALPKIKTLIPEV